MILSAILENAYRYGDRPALIFGDRRITYQELAAKVYSAAALLQHDGVRPGDRVVLSGANREPSFVFGYLACHMIGAIAVPVYSKITAAQLGKIVELTDPRRLFLSDPEIFDGSFPLQRLDAEQADPLLARSDADDAAQIIFTTGTTGLPKGVVHTHRNLSAFVATREAVVARVPDAIELIPLPLNHVFGLGRLVCALAAGSTAVIVDGFQSPGKIFQALEEHRATSFCCVPVGIAMIFELTGELLGDYRGQLRYIEIASAPLPSAHRKRLLDLLPDTRVYMAYGLTEATGSIVYTEFRGTSKPESIGRPGPGVETKIGESGQLMFRGPMVMREYWRNPEETRRAFNEGWLVTNDVGTQDEEGFLFLQGRKEEMINVGGFKVAPAEIESILREHVSVKECACVGRASAIGAGETVMAFLVHSGQAIKPSADEWVRFLRGKVEPHKIPTHFQWIDQLPKTVTGKLQRGALKERILA